MDLGLWSESGPNNDLFTEDIENNVIKNAVYGGNEPQSVFLIDPQCVDKDNFDGYYSRKITIRNNTIKTFDSCIILAMSVDRLIFENNEIIQTNTYEPIFPDVKNIIIVNCKDVKIMGNTYKNLDGKKKGNNNRQKIDKS